MNNEIPQFGGLLDILVEAGVLDPKCADPEFQGYCAQHFRPPIDLDALESAQAVYRECPHPRMVEGLEREFGVELLTIEPALQAQRRQPN